MTQDGTAPDEVLAFWLDDVGPDGWYGGGDALDAEIRQRFEPLWHRAGREGWMDWTPSPRGALALVIVLDQFPRNMFRGTEAAYATDGLARMRAKCAIDKGWDRRMEGLGRQFFYMPLCHSECLVDQERAVRLIAGRLPGEADTLRHARAHREVIRRFGRFPFRNADLGRADTAAERDFLDDGGYGAVVRRLGAEGAAAPPAAMAAQS